MARACAHIYAVVEAAIAVKVQPEFPYCVQPADGRVKIVEKDGGRMCKTCEDIGKWTP